MGATVNFTHGICHIGERIAFTRKKPPLENAPTVYHTIKHTHEIPVCISPRPSGALSIGEKPTL